MSSDRGLEATLRAAYSSALERIATLRSAQEGIRSAEPGAVNPLDLSQLDPLTPGAFPGIGTPTGRAAASGRAHRYAPGAHRFAPGAHRFAP